MIFLAYNEDVGMQVGLHWQKRNLTNTCPTYGGVAQSDRASKGKRIIAR